MQQKLALSFAATATGAPTCSEAASAALPLSNDSAPANLSPGLEGSSPNPSLNPSDTPQKASAAANLDESSPLSAFDAGHFVDGLLPADAAQSLSRNGSLVPERSAGGPVTDNCLDRDASDAGAGSERVANPETSGIAGASDRKSFAGQARAYAFPDLQDGDGSTGLERSPRLEGSNTGVGPIRLVGALALDAGTILAAGAETTDGARSGGGADLVAEAVKDDEGDSDTRGKAASRADQVAGAVSNSGAMENAEAIMDCGAASDATTVSDASCLSFASAQQNWEAGGLSPPLIRDEAQECTPKPEKPSVTPSPQYAPETPSPTPAACLDGASAVKSLKRGSELAVLDSQTLLEAPAENGLLIPGDQNHEAGDSDVPASVSGQGGSQVSGEPCPSEGTGGDDGRRASARLAGGGPKSTSLTQGLGYLAGPLAALSGLGWAPWGGESEVQFLGTTEEVKEKVRSSVGERGPNFAPQDPPEPGRTRRLWQSLKRQFSTAAKPGTPASGKPAAICDPKSSVKPLVGGPWRATFDTRSDFSLPSDWVCDVTSPSGADVTPRSQIRKPVGRRAVRESPGAGAEADRTERRTEPEHGGKKPDGAASPEETGVVLGQRPSETGTEKERAAERGESAGVKEVPPEPVASWPAAGAEALGPKREPELDSLRKVKTKSAEAVGFANQEAGTAAGQADDDAEGVSDDMLAAALGDVEQLIADHEQVGAIYISVACSPLKHSRPFSRIANI